MIQRSRQQRGLSQLQLSEKRDVSCGKSKRFETGSKISLHALTKTCLTRSAQWRSLLFAYLTATATTEQGGSFTCSLPFVTCAVHGWIVTSSG